MASSGVQSGWEGAPAFPSSGAPGTGPDYEEVARWAVTRGNLMKGTTVQRNSWVTAGYAAEGQHWYDTTLDALFVYGGSGWLRVSPTKGTVNTSTDGSGVITVSHGLGGTPSVVLVTDRGGGAASLTRKVIVNGTTSTQIQFLVGNAGSAFASNPVQFDWVAYP